MTSGNILKSITRFAIPCILTRVIQNLCPLLDAVIAGKVQNMESLAAIGVAGSVYSLVNDTVLGLVSGFTIVAGKKFGAKDERQMNAVYSHSLLISILCSVPLSVVGMLFSDNILAFLHTPQEIIVYCKQYLYVLLLGFLANALYNFFCEMMRALGDSKCPLYLLIFSTLLHFVLVVPLTKMWGVYGAALAYVLPYALADIGAMVMIYRRFPSLRLRFGGFTEQKHLIKESLSIGFPMAFTNLIVMVGVLLLSLVTNKIGTDYVAAYSCASKIGYILTTPIFGFATALSVFTAQNFGAKNYERIEQGIGRLMKWVWGLNAIIFVLTMLLGTPILNFALNHNQAAVKAGMLYLVIRCCGTVVLTPAAFYKSVLPAIGKPLFSTVSGFVEIGVRYAFPLLFSAALGFISVPLTDVVTWLVLAILLAVAYYFEFKKIRRVAV